MILKLLKTQLRLNYHRKYFFGNAIVSFLFMIIVISGNIVFQNAREYAFSRYWEKSGNADIVAMFSSKDSVMKEVCKDAKSVCYAYVDEKNCSSMTGAETKAIVVYTDLVEMSKQFNLESDVKVLNGVLMNTRSQSKVGASIGSSIHIGDNTYAVKGFTEAINFISSDREVIVVNDPEVKQDNNIIAFLNYNHNGSRIKRVVHSLEKGDIVFFNQYEGSTSINNEFNNLQNILYILSVAIFVICYILVSTSFFLSLKRAADYWVSMRLMGLSKKMLQKNIICTNTLASLTGSLLGVPISILIGRLICKITDTPFVFHAIDWKMIGIVLLVSILVILLPTVLSLIRKVSSNPLQVIVAPKKVKKNHKKSNFVIFSIICIVCVLAIAFSSKWLGIIVDNKVTYYSIKLLLSLVTVVFVMIVVIDHIVLLTRKMQLGSIRLLSYTLKNQTQRIKGVVISLAITIIMLGTLVDFSSSFKTWAADLAKEQLSFDARATVKNDRIHASKLDIFLENEKVQSVGEYYLDAGKLSNLSVYLMCESTQDAALNDIYRTKMEFNTLKQDQIIVTKQLLSTLNLEVGDRVKISLHGDIKSVRIADYFETQDYSSYLVVVSPELYETSIFKKRCLNFLLSDKSSLNKIKLSKDYSAITFESKKQLISHWQDSIISGVDILMYICVIIVIALILMLNNMIKNFVIDRKHDLSLYRTMGLGRDSMVGLLYKELVVLYVPPLILATLFIPIFSTSFIKLSASMSSYDVLCTFELRIYALILVVIMFLLMISPIRLFCKMRKMSPVESLREL